jgi:site-specific DNA recombinase
MLVQARRPWERCTMRTADRVAHTAAQKRAVGYVRVSSRDQEVEGFSLQAQRRLLADYASKNGQELLRVFEDVETAKRTGRTQFNAMVSFLRDKPDCALLAEKTDRLYRNLKDWITLDDLGVEIHMVKEGSVISESSKSGEKFIHGIRVLMAKQYVENLSEETRKGMLEKARQGLWPSYAPIGYINTAGPEGSRTKIIEPDQARAPIIRLLFRACATGNYSLQELGKLAREHGLTFRMGKGRFGKSAVHKILRNRIYCGDVDWLGEIHEGLHEPLVTKAEWLQVQEILDGRSRLHGARGKHEYTFSRMIVCGHCGGLMTGQMHKSFLYYHCNGHHGKCPAPYIREEALINAFTEVLGQLSFSDRTIETVVRLLETSRQQWLQFREAELRSLRLREANFRNRMSSLYDDRIEGVLPDWLYIQKRDELMACIGKVQSASAALVSRDGPNVPKAIELLETAQHANSKFLTMTLRQKRDLLQTVTLNSTWKDGKLTVAFRKPFDSIAEAGASFEMESVAGLSEDELMRIWLPGEDLNLEPSG